MSASSAHEPSTGGAAATAADPVANGHGRGPTVANVELFGPIAISSGPVRVTPTGRPAEVLALLAVRRGQPISAERLLDLLWPVAPASGLNALQRHLSSLRRSLRSAGLGDVAESIVRHHNGAYRLDVEAVTTDLDLLDRGEGGGPTANGDDTAPRWWLEPLMGLPHETAGSMRVSLDLAALTAAHRWLGTDGTVQPPRLIIDRLTALAHRHPHDEVVWDALRRSLGADGDGRTSTTPTATAAASIPGPATTPSPAPPPARALAPSPTDDEVRALTVISAAAEAFIAGEPAAAQAMIDAGSDEVGADLTRRTTRWFDHCDPANGMPHLLLGHLLSHGLHGRDHERIYVAVDAHALARHPDGAELVRRELVEADDPIDRFRAQRVLVYSLLGQPLDRGLAEQTEVLAAFDHPDAAIEAARFRVAVAFRRGRFDDLPALLDDVDGLMAAAYPDDRPWHGDLARNALYHHPPTRRLVDGDDPSIRFQTSALDQSVALLSRVWHDLVAGRLNAATRGAVRQLSGQLNIEGAIAIEALYLLAQGRAHEAAELIHPHRGRLASIPPDPSIQLLPVVAGHVARATGDRHLANEVVATLQPFAGEHLGVWTVDLLIEPVDDLLASLR